jgi:uncharacterized repeat protein (TIGR01451 family)
LVLLALATSTIQAQQHRATRLGAPSTRFAPPLNHPDQLRALLRDERLRPDVVSILTQAGWKGDVEDLRRAAATAPIADLKLPTGTRMPFMSSRKNGKPVALIDVLWAGSQPVDSYAFTFDSRGRRYRCVTPRPCSNFYVVDLGPVPKPKLELACLAPDRVLVGRVAEVCLVVRNTGNATEPKLTLTLPVPEGAAVSSATDGASVSTDRVVWELADIPAHSERRVCASFTRREPGELKFVPVAQGAEALGAASACGTQVAGVPGVLLEVVDLEDPVEVGKTVTYEILVRNQGAMTLTNLRLTCALAQEQDFVSGAGATVVSVDGRTLTLAPLAALEPKAEARWSVVCKAVQAADARLRVELTGDQFHRPIVESESTQQY